MTPRRVVQPLEGPVLAVAMHEEPCGGIGQREADVWFQYVAERVERDDGDPLSPNAISVRMPVAAEPYGHQPTLVFFDNLLLESDTRAELARMERRDASDVTGLLGRVGAECAGAISISPAADTLPAPAYRALSDHEVEHLFDERHGERLTQAMLESRQVMSGVQRKLVLRREGSGWSLPLAGAPGTHIVKRSSGRYDGLVANEVACLGLLAAIGLPVNTAFAFDAPRRWPDGSTEPRLLAVERFDRIARSPRPDAAVAAPTPIVRLHQEDLCQVTGRRPAAKYQANGGPTLRDLATVLRRWSAAPDVDLLVALRGAVANVCIGNGDAHGKNFSLLTGADGAHRLAPFYDVLSTDVYPALTPTFAMRFGHADRAAALDRGDLERVSRDFTVSPSLVMRTCDEVVTGIAAALDDVLHAASAAVGGTAPVLERIRDLVRARVARLHEIMEQPR